MVGELEGIVDPCVAVNMELTMSNPSHIIPQMSRLGSLNPPFRTFGVIFGAGVLTEDVGVLAFLFVGSLPLVNWWPCLTTSWADVFSLKSVPLVGLALKTGLARLGLTCSIAEAVPLTGMALFLIGLELALNTSSTTA